MSQVSPTEIWIYKFKNGGTEIYYNGRPKYPVAETYSETRFVYEGDLIKLGIEYELLKRSYYDIKADRDTLLADYLALKSEYDIINGSSDEPRK